MRQGNNDMEHGGIDAAPLRRRPRRLSELFAQISRDAEASVSLGDIIKALGVRAMAPLLVLFAAINMVPLPPPSSAILGIPLFAVAAQMAYGNRRIWLPGFLTNRAITAEQFRTIMEWILPRLRRVEKWIRPRYWPFWRRQGDRFIGIVATLLAVVVVLPIPGANWLPACSCALLGLAATERDGVLLAVGSIVSVASFALVGAIVSGAGMALHWMVSWLY